MTYSIPTPDTSCPCRRQLLISGTYKRCSNTVLSQSLWGSGPGTQVLFELSVMSPERMGLSLKHEFVLSSILLDLLLGPPSDMEHSHSCSTSTVLLGFFLTLTLGISTWLGPVKPRHCSWPWIGHSPVAFPTPLLHSCH